MRDLTLVTTLASDRYRECLVIGTPVVGWGAEIIKDGDMDRFHVTAPCIKRASVGKVFMVEGKEARYTWG